MDFSSPIWGLLLLGPIYIVLWALAIGLVVAIYRLIKGW